MVDFGAIDALVGLHQQKAAIDAQNAQDLQRVQNNAPLALSEAGLNTVRAGLLPAAQAADIAKTGAETRLIGTQNRLLPASTYATIGYQNAGAQNLIADSRLTGQKTTEQGQLNGIPVADRIRMVYPGGLPAAPSTTPLVTSSLTGPSQARSPLLDSLLGTGGMSSNQSRPVPGSGF